MAERHDAKTPEVPVFHRTKRGSRAETNAVSLGSTRRHGEKAMAGIETSSGRLPDFIRAVLSELERVTEHDRDAWSVKTHLPVVPHAAQLSLLGLLLLKGVDPGHESLFAHRDRLEELLAKAYRGAKSVWGEAMTKKKPEARKKLLNDTKAIRPTVMKAVNFADKKFGLHDMPLNGFTDNVQDAIAEITGRITAVAEQKLGVGVPGKSPPQLPSAVYGALAIATLASGMQGQRVMSAKQTSIARMAARLGSQKDDAGGPEPKAVKKLRKTLNELAPHLPEQRA